MDRFWKITGFGLTIAFLMLVVIYYFEELPQILTFMRDNYEFIVVGALLMVVIFGYLLWSSRREGVSPLQLPPFKRQERQNYTWNKRDFYVICLFCILMVGIAGFLLIKLNIQPIVISEGDDETDPRTFDLALMWIYVVILYTIFSFRFWAPVPTDQNAAITLWGRPLLNTGPGAVFAPLGFIIVITVPSVAIQREFPAEPENIYRGELKEGAELTPQQRPPIRFQYRDSITQERAKEVFGNDYVQTFPNDDGTERRVTFLADVPDDGLSARVTAEAFPIVRFMIEDPCLFLRNIGGVDPAVKQIEDEMFGVLTRFYTRMSAAQALANMEWMSLILYHAVIRRVGARGSIKSWGVDVQAAFVKYLYTSHGINTAISQAAQAPFDKQQNIITAEGTKRRLILEGEGKARAARDLEQQELQGRARGMGEIAEKLAITGREAQAAEVARVVGEGGNAIIVGPEGMTQVAALGAAFSANQRGGGSSSDRES